MPFISNITLQLSVMRHYPKYSNTQRRDVHVSVIDLAPPTIGSVHFFQPFSTLLVKGLAMPRQLEVWRRGKVQTGIRVLGVRPKIASSFHEIAHQGEQLQSQKPDGHAHTKNAIMLRACTTSSAKYFTLYI